MRPRGRAIYPIAGGAAAALALLAYAGWWLAPYFTSVLFRDAAVTTWINVATSPIHGNLEGPAPAVGRRVGADGRIATVRNLQADPSEMERAAAEVARAEAEVTELRAYLARLQDLDGKWRVRTADYADTFKKNLETDIEVLGAAADGEAAWRELQRLKPDVLVTDIEMPGLSGLELAQRIQRHELPTRVVIVTTFARAGFLRRALEAGS